MRRASESLTDGLSAKQVAELGDLRPLAERLAGYVAPQPDAAATERLLAHLRPLLAGQGAAAAQPTQEPSPGGAGYWLRLAWAQTSLFEPAFWWASLLVVALGLLVGLAAGGGALALLFALGSPLLAAAGVAYAFRPAARSAWELELACPVRPLELLYARLGLVLAFNLALALALLVAAALQEPRLVLWRLLVAWLGAMVGLAGLALYSTVRWGAVAGAAVPLVLWAAALGTAWRWAGGDAAPSGQALLDRLLPWLTGSNGALLAAVAALAAGAALLYRAGRLAAGEALQWS